MRAVDENIKSIVSTIDLIGRTVGAETVFRDWCECAALAIANGCDVPHGARWEAREKRYLSLIGKYDRPAFCYADAVFEPRGDDIVAKIEEFPWLA